MTEINTANEFGKVRVFQLAFEIQSELAHTADYERLEKALGVIITNREDVQIVPATTLHDLGLAQFLMMGHGIAEEDIAPDTARLNGLEGSFAIIRSGAFDLSEITLKDTPDVKWIATYKEEVAVAPPLSPLTSDASKGAVPAQSATSKKPKSDARIGGMVATVALILMGLLVWLMIWIAS